MCVSVCLCVCVWGGGFNRDMVVTEMRTEDRGLRLKQMWGKGGCGLIGAWACNPDDGKE